MYQHIRLYVEIYGFFPVSASVKQRACASNHFTKLKDPFGYVTSRQAREKGLGSLSCPWRIEAHPGQSITITLITLGTTSTQHTCKPIVLVYLTISNSNTSEVL